MVELHRCMWLPPNRSSPGDDRILELFKPKLRALPRLHELIMKGLGDDGSVWLKLPPVKANAGRALASCKDQIDSLLNRGPQVFKIGLSGDPLFRFYKEATNSSPGVGYYHEKPSYKGMYILFCSITWDEAALMEAALIDCYKEWPGNQNIRPGGEGRQTGEAPYFTCRL